MDHRIHIGEAETKALATSDKRKKDDDNRRKDTAKRTSLMKRLHRELQNVVAMVVGVATIGGSATESAEYSLLLIASACFWSGASALPWPLFPQIASALHAFWERCCSFALAAFCRKLQMPCMPFRIRAAALPWPLLAQICCILAVAVFH